MTDDVTGWLCQALVTQVARPPGWRCPSGHLGPARERLGQLQIKGTNRPAEGHVVNKTVHPVPRQAKHQFQILAEQRNDGGWRLREGSPPWGLVLT